MDEPQGTLLDGQCPACGALDVHAEDCPRPGLLVMPEPPPPGAKLVLWLRNERDHRLAVLYVTYLPRLRALHDEMAAERDRIMAEYDAKVTELRAAAFREPLSTCPHGRAIDEMRALVYAGPILRCTCCHNLFGTLGPVAPGQLDGLCQTCREPAA